MSLNIVLVSLVLTVLLVLIVAIVFFVVRTRQIARHAERMVPPIGKFVRVDGNQIHYVDQGEGKAILFLHGLGAQLHHFHGPLFSRFPQGYRLIAMDRPGSGYSKRISGATGSVSEQALLIRNFIEALKLDKPLVVGHSLGGAVALTLAVEHPEVIAGLALVSPYTHHQDEVPQHFEALNIESRLLRRMIAETIAVPMAEKYAAETLSFIFKPQKPTDDYMTVGGGYLGLRPGHFFATSTDFVALRRDFPAVIERFPEIRMPVAVLFGSADRMLDYGRHGLALREQIVGVEIELIDDVGHMPQFANPRRVVSFITGMAERVFRQKIST